MFLGFVVCTAIIVWRIFQSKWWADLAINFRLSQIGHKRSKRLAGLVFLEILLYITIGALSFYVHKGHFAGAEMRTIMPILSVFLFRFNPWKGAAASFFVVFLGYLVVAYAPQVHGVDLNEYPDVFGLGVLIGLSIFHYKPFGATRISPVVSNLPRRIDRLGHGSEFRQIIVGFSAFVALGSVLLIASKLFSSKVSMFNVNLALFISCLVTLSWLIQRLIGIRTVALPAIGMCSIYIIYYYNHNPFVAVVALACLLGVTIFLLWCVRILEHEPAMVVDLALVLCVSSLIRNTPAISGADEILNFRTSWVSALDPYLTAVLQMTIVLIVSGVAIAASHCHQARARVLALANFKVGLLNGFGIGRDFSLFAALPLIIIVGSVLLFHLSSVPISISRLRLEEGLIVLLFGYIMYRGHALIAYAGILALYGFLFLALAKYGIQSGTILGLSLIVTPLILKPRTL